MKTSFVASFFIFLSLSFASLRMPATQHIRIRRQLIAGIERVVGSVGVIPLRSGILSTHTVTNLCVPRYTTVHTHARMHAHT